MAIDSDLFFARRLGLGLKPGEMLPEALRDWAMAQLREVPPLGFLGPDGADLRDKLPPGIDLFKDFSEACKAWEVYRIEHNKLEALSGKIPAGEYSRREHHEIYVKHMLVPRWRDCLAKTLTAVNGKSPVFERFWMFWNNHFTVSTPEAAIKLFYGPHIRNIRNRLTGNFADLLFDAVANPAMLMYLNNDTSTGPRSRAAKGEKVNNTLNENLGRELLELHTMSPAAGYTQQDVIETALILTGWQLYAGPVTNGGTREKIPYGTRFNPYRHEPGTRTVLGKQYKPKGNGKNQLHELMRDFTDNPATAKFIAFKLARHFIADEPPQECVDRLARTFAESKGDLIAVHSAVVDEVLAFAPQFPKMTTPENWLLQSYRTTGARVPLSLPMGGGEAVLHVFKELGQSFDECRQPNGWPDLKADWISKTMLDRRVRQAHRIGQQESQQTANDLGDYAERLAGHDSPLAPLVRRAESRAEAVVLLLTSPQFLKM